MQETEYRKFLEDWKFECGGPHVGPVFKKGTEVSCTPDRAAALDKRGKVEELKKSSKAVSFNKAVATWWASGSGDVAESATPAAVAVSEKTDANPAKAGADTDGADAGVKPGAGDSGGRKENGGAGKP